MTESLKPLGPSNTRLLGQLSLPGKNGQPGMTGPVILDDEGLILTWLTTEPLVIARGDADGTLRASPGYEAHLLELVKGGSLRIWTNGGYRPIHSTETPNDQHQRWAERLRLQTCAHTASLLMMPVNAQARRLDQLEAHLRSNGYTDEADTAQGYRSQLAGTLASNALRSADIHPDEITELIEIAQDAGTTASLKLAELLGTALSMRLERAQAEAEAEQAGSDTEILDEG